MENKYYDVAKIIVDTTEFFDGKGNIFPNEETVISIMCQLAEKVESFIKQPLSFDSETGKINRLFTEEYVEELLEKQRELSAQQTLTNREDILNAKLKI
jgi:hypothetical protein